MMVRSRPTEFGKFSVGTRGVSVVPTWSPATPGEGGGASSRRTGTIPDGGFS
jgi:hypothetical protein